MVQGWGVGDIGVMTSGGEKLPKGLHGAWFPRYRGHGVKSWRLKGNRPL